MLSSDWNRMHPSMRVLRLFRTVRYLKKSQIIDQVKVRCRCQLERQSSLKHRLKSEIPEWHGIAWQPIGEFLPPGKQDNTAQQILAGELCFLHSQRRVGWPPVWHQPDSSDLWQYNLHYFEYLWTLEYEDAKRITQSWIEDYSQGAGRVGWDPYPCSLRLMNWCSIFYSRYRALVEKDRQWCQILWASISIQAEWLRTHLETHLLGNHLLENGIALAFVGSCFKGYKPRVWLNVGLNILKQQLPEQVLDDGGHFERSAMYQTRLVYALAMLVNTGHGEIRNAIEKTLILMVNALEKMLHPDGEIALFNDSALNIYNNPFELIRSIDRILDRAFIENRPSLQTTVLKETGYYGEMSSSYHGHHRIICDAGEIGPDYIPGHAHGDIFSFELSLNDRRVVVDSGTFDYSPSAMRSYCRSTHAHNTVEIEQTDQCEFWGAFRVGRRARPHDIEWQATRDGFRLAGWHDGYRWLKGRPVHKREFTWSRCGILMVRDSIESSTIVSAVTRLHLHPDCRPEMISNNRIKVTYPAGLFETIFAGDGHLWIEDSWYCPEFGLRIRNQTLLFRYTGRNVTTGFCITTIPILGFDLNYGAKTDDRDIQW